MSKKSRDRDRAIRESIKLSQEIEKKRQWTHNQQLRSKPLRTNLGDLLIKAMWSR